MKYHYIEVKVNSDIKPPFFPASAIRGAFGYALQEKTCIAKEAKDDACLYCRFFEGEGYRLYRVDVPLSSSNFDFGLYLFGEACKEVALVLVALNSMLIEFNEYGIKINKKILKFPQSTFYLNGKKVFENQKFLYFNAEPKIFLIEKYYYNVKIKILTPSLFKGTNKTFKTKIDLKDILLSIYKYINFLDSDTNHLAPTSPQYTLIPNKQNDPKPLKTTRRSYRQNKTIIYNGLVGEIVVKYLDPKSYELLMYGEIVGIGNKTAQGFGTIHIEKYN